MRLIRSCDSVIIPRSVTYGKDSDIIIHGFSDASVDFAGPVRYRIAKGKVGKAYIALFTCTTTRAVHLKLCRDLTAPVFQRAVKEFVVRRGSPKLMVSDNGRTFIATRKWL